MWRARPDIICTSTCVVWRSMSEYFEKVEDSDEGAAGTKRRQNSKKEMPLSCQRCRLRKVKCNFAHPCSSCVKLGVECIQVPNDMRKKRPPANYVLLLEKRIDAFSKFFRSLEKLQSPQERQTFLDSRQGNIGRLMAENGSHHSEKPECEKEAETEPSRNSDSSSPAPASKIRPVYGPTSVYDNSDHRPQTLNQRKEVREISSLQNLAKDPDVLHCLRLFFTWQYPDHNMFVFREAFLGDFLSPKPSSLYCLLVLVLSICALGARMSDIDTIYSRSISYYNEAKSSLLSSLEHPSITAVQSFLLLAFYDICNGNNSTGWMLLGNAMRMGFDLGFQLNPEVWFLKSHGALKELDVAIRSRIYWGCYMADHFISLVLGRPSSLKLLDASIPESEDLPELEWIDDYKYVPDNVTNISDPLKNIINLINISDNMLNDIFTRSEDEANAHRDADPTTDDLNLISRLSKLFEYNAQIMKWKSNLPPDLNWDQESLKSSDNPTASTVRYYYYILILCLNRPFVGIVKDFKDKNHLSPAFICTSAIEDLYVAIQKFELTHGLRRASVFIVYCSILSISVILLTTTSELLGEDKRVKLKYFLNVLAGCSKTWALAEKSHKMIEAKLQLQFVDDPDFAPAVVDKRTRKRGRKPSKVIQAKTEPSEQTLELQVPSILEPISNSSSITSAPIADINGEFDEPGDERALENQRNGKSMPLSEGQTAHYPDFTTLDESNVEFFGGPPVLMTSDLFNEDWEALFPDSIFSLKLHHL